MSTAAVMPPPSPSGPALCAAVAQIQAGVARMQELVAAGSLGQLTDASVAQVAQQLAAVGQAVSATTAVALGRVVDSGYAEVEGFVSTYNWWASRTRLSRDAAADQVRLAKRLSRHYPATGSAWTTGAATGEHAAVIATGVDAVLHHMKRALRRDAAETGEPLDPAVLQATLDQARGVLEGELLTLARTWGPETLRVALTHARQAADPDGASKAQMDAEADARVMLVEVGDTAVLTAHLPVLVGAKLRTILDHYRSVLHHHDDGPDARQPARFDPDEVDPVTGDPIVRSNKQRDAAAFMTLIDATLDAGLGSNAVSERPHLDVVVTLADLANGTGAAVIERTGTLIPAASTARIACDADVRVVLVDGQYRDPQTGDVVEPAVAAILLAGVGVLDYGRAHRIVPPALRKALAHRDRGCIFPGCHRPPQHTQAHHVIEWLPENGPTSLANCVLLCSRHHHLVHEGRWRMQARPEIPYNQPGHWRFIPPERVPQP